MSALGLNLPLAMIRPTTAMPTPRSQPQDGGDSIAALCAAAMAGDQTAFERLHRRLNPGLQRMLQNRTGGRADLAEELAQKAWIVVWEALSARKYDPAKSAITTFVYAVSHKVWLQYLRTASRQAGGAQAGLTAEPFTGAGEPSDAAGLAELLGAVRECMEGGDRGVAGALNPEERALVRAVASGHSDRSLARMLGLAASTVNVRKRTAFEKVRRFLAVRGHRGDGGAEGDGGERNEGGGE